MEVIVLEDKEKKVLYEKLNEIAPLESLYYFETILEDRKIFKNIKYKIVAIQKEEVKKYIKEYFNKIGELMKVQIHCEMQDYNDSLNINLVSNHSSSIIGKEGKHLEALQILIRQTIYKKTGIRIKINLDASEYKLKKQKRLEKEIRNLAYEVLNTKIDVKLDPMNSYDRRIVHSIISEYNNLKTESNGESPNRYVIISYK